MNQEASVHNHTDTSVRRTSPDISGVLGATRIKTLQIWEECDKAYVARLLETRLTDSPPCDGSKEGQ